MHDHVVESDVVDNERKRMHQSEDEECIRGPSVKDLEFLMRDTRQERDPIRLAGSCTGLCQHCYHLGQDRRTIQKAYMPEPSTQTEFQAVASRRNLDLTSNMDSG